MLINDEQLNIPSKELCEKLKNVIDKYTECLEFTGCSNVYLERYDKDYMILKVVTKKGNKDEQLKTSSL